MYSDTPLLLPRLLSLMPSPPRSRTTEPQEMYFLRNVDEVLEFLDRVAIGQIYRERRAGGNEEEGSDAVHSSAEGPRLSTASRVMTDSSEDDEIEQVRVFPS